MDDVVSLYIIDMGSMDLGMPWDADMESMDQLVP